MSAKPFSLGRGLSSLIPKKSDAPAPAAVPPSVGMPIRPFSASTSSAEEIPDLGRVHEVPLGKIKPNSRQPRHHFDHVELESLVMSIREHGIIQPLVARKLADGTFELIAGERRLRAATMLGLTAVPVVLRETKDDRDKLVLALIENINRENLNAIDEALGYSQLAEEFGLTQDEIGKRVGKSRPTVANMMRLLKLPIEIQKAVIEGRISTAQAKVLVSVEEPGAQHKMYTSMLAGGVTVRAAEQASRENKDVVHIPNAQTAADTETLAKIFGTKVGITGSGSKGAIKISYFSPEEYRAILKKIGGRG